MHSKPNDVNTSPGASPGSRKAINVSGDTNNPYFALSANAMSYTFYACPKTGDLISDHFGAPVDDFTPPGFIFPWGWNSGLSLHRREFPDLGRGDLRLPAIHLEHTDGSTVSAFKYRSHKVVPGKPRIPKLPATFGDEEDVSTLLVTMVDELSDVIGVLSYSIFPKYNAVARSFKLTNNGRGKVLINRAASFSSDFPNLDLELIETHGDWSQEFAVVKRKIDHGETTFRSAAGFSSHLYNPFFALASPTTTERTGEAWGFHLVWSGSFEATAEKFSTGTVRVLLGLNQLQTNFDLQPGESFQSPEAIAVYSSEGIGGMSRSFHDLYRHHLSRSKFTAETRPVLLNSWEGLGCNIDEESLVRLAGQAAEFGIQLFAMDDGWFGDEYPRKDDTQGLGDWIPDPVKFPRGLGPFVERVNEIKVTKSKEHIRFGIWVEPEMVNPKSTFYREHADWVLHSGNYERTMIRDQLVLDLGLPEVQEHIIDSMTRIIESANIQYVKWDSNRGIHETSHPSTSHRYVLGLYRILSLLTTKYPEILFEGCASGSGRFDPGMLYYFPQHWVSDNTDAADRLAIQLGASLVYPPSSMSSHITARQNYLTNRQFSISYRAHVALMCGSFGLELNPSDLSKEEAEQIPGIIDLWKRVNPLVISGDFYRLAIPSESNWPAVIFVSKDKRQAIVFAFQQLYAPRPAAPPLKMQGLLPEGRYKNDWDGNVYSGRTYMNAGLGVGIGEGVERKDYWSRIVWLQLN